MARFTSADDVARSRLLLAAGYTVAGERIVFHGMLGLDAEPLLEVFHWAERCKVNPAHAHVAAVMRDNAASPNGKGLIFWDRQAINLASMPLV